MADEPTIVAMGGGGFSMEQGPSILDDWILEIADADRPEICFIPTASGDAEGYIADFYRAFTDRGCRPVHLDLFNRRTDDLRDYLLRRDIVYVGGGNTANMLEIWRIHGLDEILEEAWRAGVVLCGLSAGSLCWYECGVTDSFGTELAPLHDGLGFLEGSHSPHYDGEPDRRPTYQSLVQSGELPPGYAADDGVALVYRGRALDRVVSREEGRYAWRVEPGEADVIEERIEPEVL